MKAVIINGSYHREGVTSRMIDEFTRGLKDSHNDMEIERVDLLDVPIELCKGCGSCASNDGKSLAECPQPDYPVVKRILQEMLDCDILVYATPVCEVSVTALLKRFMERSMTILYMGKTGPVPRNATIKKKTGVVLVSCGSPFPISRIKGVTKYCLDLLGLFCNGFGCGKVKKLEFAGIGSKEQVTGKKSKKIYRLATKVGSMQ